MTCADANLAVKLEQMSSKPSSPDRDFGKTWKDRLEEARRASRRSAEMSEAEKAQLHDAAMSLDVSSPEDSALFWSGKDILTAIPFDENVPEGPKWWDKLAPLEAQVVRDLGLAVSVEDTPCGRYMLGLGTNNSPNNPPVIQKAWEIISARFAEAVRGRVEILAVGAWEDGIFRSVELEALLGNGNVTALNGLDRGLLPNSAEEAFVFIRRWDIERNRRYVEFLDNAADATPRERAVALDDYREAQMWYEQDFFDQVGSKREVPALAPHVLSATDRAREVGAWKYSTLWRGFVQSEA